jgi:hypothetical protein
MFQTTNQQNSSMFSSEKVLMVDFLTGVSPRRPTQVLFVPSPGFWFNH